MGFDPYPMEINNKNFHTLLRKQEKISDQKEKTWQKFLDEYGSHPVAARPFWKEINKAKEQKTSKSFPNLRYENVNATDDKQKCQLFGSILKGKRV